MENREIMQLVGAGITDAEGFHKSVEMRDLFDYYPAHPQQQIRETVRGLVGKNMIRWSAYEDSGLCLTPEGLRAYEEGRV